MTRDITCVSSERYRVRRRKADRDRGERQRVRYRKKENYRKMDGQEGQRLTLKTGTETVKSKTDGKRD